MSVSCGIRLSYLIVWCIDNVFITTALTYMRLFSRRFKTIKKLNEHLLLKINRNVLINL